MGNNVERIEEAMLKCLIIIIAIFFEGCAIRANVRVDSTPLGEITKSTKLIFLYQNNLDAKSTLHSKLAIQECSGRLKQLGYNVSSGTYMVGETLESVKPALNDVLVLTSATVSDGEDFGNGEKQQCAVFGNVVRCNSERKTNILYRKSIIMDFNRLGSGERLHQLTMFALTPSGGMSAGTIREMCRVGLENFPDLIEAKFLKTEIKEED